jgi:hypothetical protein
MKMIKAARILRLRMRALTNDFCRSSDLGDRFTVKMRLRIFDQRLRISCLLIPLWRETAPKMAFKVSTLNGL